MTAGYFAPLPPARTGVADYAAALLTEMQRLGDVRQGDASADVCLYHLGNNQLHREIYRRAIERPGVAVLHDAVLHHFFLGALSREEYVEEFTYNYGEASRALAEELWQARARSAQDPRYFERAMVRRVAERSRAVVVHNPAAARIVRAHAPGAEIHELPHLFVPPEPAPTAREAREWRERHGIGAAAFVFGVFGHLRESKRLPQILRAFERLRSDADVALLIAGDFVSTDLERFVGQPLGLRRAPSPPDTRRPERPPQAGSLPHIVRVPYLPEREWWTAAAAVDAGINLRHPAAGETSGIAIRLMGIGKPVIVTVGEETARFPESACLRVDPGVAEEAMLVEYMRLLAARPGIAQEIGRAAAAHIAAHHGAGDVARRYWEVLCAHCG